MKQRLNCAPSSPQLEYKNICISDFKDFLDVFKRPLPPRVVIARIDNVITSRAYEFYNNYKVLFPESWHRKTIFDVFVLNNMSINDLHKHCIIMLFYMDTLK
jgi:hypothetical protein